MHNQNKKWNGVGQARPMRGVRRMAGAATFALILSSCTSIGDFVDNGTLSPSARPVTVDNVRSGRLARIGAAQHPKILETYGGEYANARLERMVAAIVGRLVTVSDNPGQVYQVSILDSPLVNAFALPGGYLYVSRGLLALANDKSQLAAVIAHEMAHVTANHGILRQRKEAEAGLGQRVVSEVLNDNSRASLTAARNKLDLAQFSRIQELEADAIGVSAMGEAGFNPYAAADFQKVMATFSNVRSHSAAENMVDFLSTHPSTPQRVDLAMGHARKLGPRAPITTAERNTYFDGIDGMLYGDDSAEGFVRDQTYAHKELGIEFTFPGGFNIENRAASVVGSRATDGAAIRFDGVDVDAATSLTTYLASGWVEGLDMASIQAASINGLPAAIAKAQVGTWSFDITIIRSNDQVYRLLSAVPTAGPPVEPLAAATRQSFRALSSSESAALRPLRIKIIKAKPTQTAASLALQLQGVQKSERFFRALNGLSTTEPLVPGRSYKTIVE